MKLPSLVLALTLTTAAARAESPGASAGRPYLLAPTPEEQLIGAVDVCVRWGADPDHLEGVVMLGSSGDKALDATVPDLIRSMPYPRPQDDAGEWFGLSLSFGAAPPHKAPPDCQAVMGAGAPA